MDRNDMPQTDEFIIPTEVWVFGMENHITGEHAISISFRIPVADGFAADISFLLGKTAAEQVAFGMLHCMTQLADD